MQIKFEEKRKNFVINNSKTYKSTNQTFAYSASLKKIFINTYTYIDDE
jgi:hypothetical protein